MSVGFSEVSTEMVKFLRRLDPACPVLQALARSLELGEGQDPYHVYSWDKAILRRGTGGDPSEVPGILLTGLDLVFYLPITLGNRVEVRAKNAMAPRAVFEACFPENAVVQPSKFHLEVPIDPLPAWLRLSFDRLFLAVRGASAVSHDIVASSISMLSTEVPCMQNLPNGVHGDLRNFFPSN